ncbi:MAG: alpha/beta fold hydrolase [Nocardiopsaceae bacterium]|nr:alpha/beta fold hydrolase [Nocardiopsaceae bacterium]
MPWYDLPLEQLRDYRTATREPAGLDGWWAARVADARDRAKPVTLTRHEPGLYGAVEVYDAEFSGAGGDRIRAWYIKPPESTPGGGEARTVTVTFIGYGGGRGAPAEHILLPAIGYPVFVMDTRGQGGRWTFGATGDAGSGGPENSQVMTRGVTSPETYYYTRLITDAALAVDAAAELAGPDAKISVRGHSQGGGLALAAAALHGDRIAACQADVPFLCDIQRAITLAPNGPYIEIPQFLAHNVDLADRVLDTLRYVDCALLARRVTAPTLMSASLMDPICPPSTVFAAYNEITAEKEIVVNPYTTHEVAHGHSERLIRHLREHLLRARCARPA